MKTQKGEELIEEIFETYHMDLKLYNSEFYLSDLLKPYLKGKILVDEAELRKLETIYKKRLADNYASELNCCICTRISVYNEILGEKT